MRLGAGIGLALMFLYGCAGSGSDNRYANLTRPELLANFSSADPFSAAEKLAFLRGAMRNLTQPGFTQAVNGRTSPPS
jgi:hypothetical protein